MKRSDLYHGGVLEQIYQIDLLIWSSSDYPLFAMSKDLGQITATAAPVIWAVGMTFDTESTSALQYNGLQGNSQRGLYYVSNFSDTDNLVSWRLPPSFPFIYDNRESSLDRPVFGRLS